VSIIGLGVCGLYRFSGSQGSQVLKVLKVLRVLKVLQFLFANPRT